jgi:hypothetical protein
MNVWGLNSEGLQWLMVETVVEGVSFVECLYDWGGSTLEIAKAEGRYYDFVFIKRSSLFSE